MKLYKLTDADDRTHGGCQWGPGVTVETDGRGHFSGPGFTYWYTDPLLAILLNPIQAKFDLASAHLWEGEGEPVKNDHGLQVGCARATTLRRVELPVVSDAARVRFGILCTLEVYKAAGFVAWAEGWLSGRDRSSRSMAAAARAVEAAQVAASVGRLVSEKAWFAAEAAVTRAAEALAKHKTLWAEWVAAEAAQKAVAWAVRAAQEDGNWAAVLAAEAAQASARAAEDILAAPAVLAAESARAALAKIDAVAGKPLDLAALARRAVEEEAAQAML